VRRAQKPATGPSPDLVPWLGGAELTLGGGNPGQADTVNGLDSEIYRSRFIPGIRVRPRPRAGRQPRPGLEPIKDSASRGPPTRIGPDCSVGTKLAVLRGGTIGVADDWSCAAMRSGLCC